MQITKRLSSCISVSVDGFLVWRVVFVSLYSCVDAVAGEKDDSKMEKVVFSKKYKRLNFFFQR